MSERKPGLKVLVCGGRDFMDRVFIFSQLDAIHAETPIAYMVHGAQRGADAISGEWCEQRLGRGRVTEYPADWKKYDKAAGPIRNRKMLQTRPDLVIAFPGGAGTKNMIAQAKYAGVPVMEIKK